VPTCPRKHAVVERERDADAHDVSDLPAERLRDPPGLALERFALEPLRGRRQPTRDLAQQPRRVVVYNWRTATWSTVDGPRTGVTSDRAFTWTNTTTARDYVSSTGEIRFRVRGERSSSSGFTTRTDLVRFSIEY
jgi:hypothetical protein